jgi:hypothetical protein
VIDPILEEITKSRGASYFLANYSGMRPRWKRLS